MFNQILDLTEKLVAFQTFHPNFAEKRACLGFVKDLVKNDLQVQEFEFNGFPSLLLSTSDLPAEASAKAGVSPHYDLLLAGHIDVVSALESMFQMTQKDGKLLGRGVYDMKGSVAVMLRAQQEYARQGEGKSIGLLLTSDEEIDGLNGTRAVLEKAKLTADFALLPDNGDDWEIMLAERGLVHARVKSEEREKVIGELAKYFPQRGNENTEWCTTFTIENTQPFEKGWVDIRVRFVNETDERVALQIFDKAKVIRRHRGARTSEENAYVQRLRRIIQAETGLLVKFSKECRTNESDAIYFAQQNIPAALVRPLGGGMHRDDEWLDTATLEKFSRILQTFLDENSFRS